MICQCDEAKPVCSRCTRVSAACLYRDAFELVHRDQTTSAARYARSKWRKRVKEEPDDGESCRSALEGSAQPAGHYQAQLLFQQQSATTSARNVSRQPFDEQSLTKVPGGSAQKDRAPAGPSAPPQQDLQESAFMRFRFDFLDPPDRAYSKRGTLEGVPKLCLELPRTHVLVLTVSAVSLANYAARMHSPAVAREAQTYYVRALSSLKTATGDRNIVTTVETLLSAHILSLYEALSKPDHDFSFAAHLEGSESIMKLMTTSETRGDQKAIHAHSGFGVLLLKHALFRHLAYYIRPPLWLERLILSIPDDGIQSDLIRIAYRATIVCAGLKEAQTSAWYGRPFTESPQNLLEHAKALDAHFREWDSQVPTDLIRDSFEISAARCKASWVRNLFDQIGAPHHMDVVRSSWRVHEWNMYRTTRLNLNCCMLDLVAVLELRGLTETTARETAHAETRNDIQESTYRLSQADYKAAIDTVIHLARSTLEAVPHALGIKPPSPATLFSLSHSGIIHSAADHSAANQLDPAQPHEVSGLRGYHLVWPLFNVLKSLLRPQVRCAKTIEMETWVKSFFQFAWHNLGIAQAEAYRRWYEQGLPAGF